MAKQILTQERLKELLHYDPETGLFTRLTTTGSRWKAGDVAGSMDNGYIRIRLDGVLYQAHRLAFLYMLGYMPVEVDHDDQVKDNNRWDNLNPSTRTENSKNQKLHKRNTSGHCGVWWDKRKKKWKAQIFVNGKLIHLGYFTHKADAIAARKAAEIKYGFHENHGNKPGDNK